MATIKIETTNYLIKGVLSYRIFIDGEKVGSLTNGQTRDFEIKAGQHKIIAKIDWCSCPVHSLEIGDNETKTLLIGGFKNEWWIMRITGVSALLSILLSYALDSKILLLFMLPGLLVIGYYLTFGSNKYLTLKEV